MDTLAHLMAGLTAALSLQNLAFALIGCVLGTLIGVLPGLGPAAGTAILIPLTFKLDPTGAIIMLSAIYYGAMYGGTVTSVLINVPGEAASVITCIDGHQMAKQGRGGTALGIAAIGSFVGGIFATIALVVVAPPLAQVALKFGPPEFFALMLVGLCLITGLGGRSLLAGLAMAMLGLLIAMIGIDPVRGAPRFTLGIPNLYDGLGFIPVVMGLFGVAEILLGIAAAAPPGHQDRPRLLAAFARGVAPLHRRHRDAGPASAFSSGLFRVSGRSFRPSWRMCSRSACRRRRSGLGTAPSKAWRRPRAPTTPTPMPR